MKKEFADILERVANQWNLAEQRIKTAERLNGEVVFPAINELRYAGRRLVDAINLTNTDDGSDSTDESVRTFVNEVEQFCLRAEHDAIDASILFVHQRVEQLVENFGILTVTQYFPKYAELRKKIDEVDNFITSSRKDREQRPETYRDIAENYLPTIISLYKEMEYSEEAIKSAVEEARKEQEKSDKHYNFMKRLTIVSVILGLAGLVIGVV